MILSAGEGRRRTRMIRYAVHESGDVCDGHDDAGFSLLFSDFLQSYFCVCILLLCCSLLLLICSAGELSQTRNLSKRRMVVLSSSMVSRGADEEERGEEECLHAQSLDLLVFPSIFDSLRSCCRVAWCHITIRGVAIVYIFVLHMYQSLHVGWSGQLNFFFFVLLSVSMRRFTSFIEGNVLQVHVVVLHVCYASLHVMLVRTVELSVVSCHIVIDHVLLLFAFFPSSSLGLTSFTPCSLCLFFAS